MEAKMETEAKNILIPWTGGFDSTALILKALSEGHHVFPKHIDILNNKEGSEKEEKAIDSIYEYLQYKLEIWKGVRPHEVAKINDDIAYPNSYTIPKWIIYSCLDMGYINKNIENRQPDEIWIGYTKSDGQEEDFDLNHHMTLIPIILNSMIKLTYPEIETVPKILFPFVDMYKTQILRKYYDNDNFRPVFEMLSTCPSGGSYKTGCECEKCLKLKRLSEALYKKEEDIPNIEF